MTTSRRDFTKLLGASLAIPAAAPVAGLSMWERAELEVQQVGEVSAEVARIILDNQGLRGVYDDPEEFEELRASLARKIRDHKVVREFAAQVPDEIEPVLTFEA